MLGSFGPNSVPKCLRAVTILGMQQARKWGLGSLNEFRKFFGLKTYETFEEINSDQVYISVRFSGLGCILRILSM